MPIILAFLSKDGKYIAAILALLAAVGWIYHRGETHVEAAEAKVVAAQVVHNQEVENAVSSRVAAAVKDYDALAPIPVPTRVPVLVCQSSGGTVRSSAGAAGGSNGAGAGVPVNPGGADEGFDPAPAVSQTGTEADAEIEHLQKKVKLLQNLVAAYQSAGLVAK
jgi:hypothetical protein